MMPEFRYLFKNQDLGIDNESVAFCCNPPGRWGGLRHGPCSKQRQTADGGFSKLSNYKGCKKSSGLVI